MNSRLKQQTLTEEEETLLKRIVEKGVRQLKPSIGSSSVHYPDIEDIVKDLDLNWSTVKVYLEALTKKGFLLVNEKHFALFCPICDSADVYSMYVCTKCKGSNVNRVRLIEHIFCGYTGIREEFESGTKLICPNCKTDLGDRKDSPPGDGSREDYRVIGTSFECEDCGNRFDKPNISHVCQSCGEEFNYRTAVYTKYFDFELPEKVIAQYRKRAGVHILLVEDNQDDATIIIHTLEDAGKDFTMDHANTGINAVEKVKKNVYDIILLDFMLPGMNGLEILKKIRGSKIETPVIMFTGADDRETAVAAMKLGASDYLVKSVELYKRLPGIIEQTVTR